jgi:hypothetical protein
MGVVEREKGQERRAMRGFKLRAAFQGRAAGCGYGKRRDEAFNTWSGPGTMNV